MRPSVFGIWIGLLVLVLATAVVRFWVAGAVGGSALPGLVFNFAILTIFVLAVWFGALAFLEARHRRQVLALQAGTPGSVAFPSYPTRGFGEGSAGSERARRQGANSNWHPTGRQRGGHFLRDNGRSPATGV